MARVSFPILVLSILLAGCAGEPGEEGVVYNEVETTVARTGDPAATVTKAPATRRVSDEGGTIFGTVTDDELRPVEGVIATLLEFEADTTTDATGRYAFTDVPAGPYQLTFDHSSFVSAGRKVDVSVGVETRLDVILERLAFGGPWHETFAYSGEILVGEAFTDLAPCEQGATECYYRYAGQADLNTIVLEADWTPTIPGGPLGGSQLYFQVSSGDGGTLYKDGYLPPQGKQQFQGDWPQDGTATFRQFVVCDLFWVCVQQKFDIYITLFYIDPPPDDFSILP